jgi:beta-lactamase regulating signal transducer with metallopeptidase domain
MAAALLRASLTGAGAVVIVWLVCRLMPRLSAATHATLWWCVAAKFVITLVWMAPVRVPILPAPLRPLQVMMTNLPRARGALVSRQDVYLIARNGTAKTAGIVEVRSASAGTPAAAKTSSAWPTALLVVWAAGVIIAIGAGMRHWRRTQALVDRSPDAPEAVRSLTASLASRLKLSCTPRVKVSDDIDTPLVIGLRHAVVLLPNQIFARMSERQQEMSICHELAHIKRADLRLGCLPALAEALFFFHPFAKFAAREYALWREAACDAAVLTALDAAPGEYGRLLLDLGVAEPRSGALAATAASRSPAQLKRRLVMLSDASAPSTTSRVLTAMAIGAALLALVPIQLVARSSAAPTRATKAAQNTPPLPPRPPLVFTSREAPQADYILFDADDTVTTGTTMGVTMRTEDGTSTDGRVFVLSLAKGPSTGPIATGIAHARQFKKPGEKLLWFRRDDHEYVVRDAATLAEIEAMWKPLRTSAPAPGASNALGAIAVAKPDRPMTDAERATVRQVLETKLRALTTAMATLAAHMHANAPPSKNFDGLMADMGRQMEALGRELQQTARGEFNIQSLIDHAIAQGLATPVK